MTFRGRLRLFFTIIVIVPMVAMTAVLFELTAESERGKADAMLDARLETALLSYQERREAAADQARRLPVRVRAALTSGDARVIRDQLAGLVRSNRRIVSATFSDAGGNRVIRAGSARGIAPATFHLRGPDGRLRGTLSVSVTDARGFVRSAARRPRSTPRAPRLEFLMSKRRRAVGEHRAGRVQGPAWFRGFRGGRARLPGPAPACGAGWRSRRASGLHRGGRAELGDHG